MELKELIFAKTNWTNKTLWDCIQMELRGKLLYIPKINVKETKYRDELIRGQFHRNNKSIKQLSEEFNLCEMRIRQIVKEE